MNDFEAEERIQKLLDLIDNLQLQILKLDTKTISNVIKNKIKNKDKLIRQYYIELNTLVNANIENIDKDLMEVITDNANLYLKTDINTYNKALKKGIIKVKPIITSANKKILKKSIKNGLNIINQTIDSIKINRNNKISNMIAKIVKGINSGTASEKLIIDASKELLQESIKIKDNSNRQWNDITAYIRMSVKTINNKNYILQQEQLAKDIGIPEKNRKIETSSHYGSRPDHAKWQGKVFEYKEFLRVCQPNTVTGICGINCRHRYYEYIDGISKPAFKHYNEAEDKKRYEIQQRQRHIEANIRKYKRELAVAEGLGVDTAKAKNKVSEWQKMAREHTKKYNLLRRYEREQIS